MQTLTPLIQEVQWSQTAKLIAATTVDVRADRQFVVQVFVSTAMTSTQNPDGLNTVTPYTVTLDRDESWQITDVAGIVGVLWSVMDADHRLAAFGSSVQMQSDTVHMSAWPWVALGCFAAACVVGVAVVPGASSPFAASPADTDELGNTVV
ncbi:hypothetical protein [Gordonia sp. (in: high G+C Gram-positive bacteria)]|uniref:hypothetical protein n=1 Tax=Gordonia sp. (in: high G+C Gram-positive bacteria) TaxID=84139 RepID=UPI003F954B20